MKNNFLIIILLIIGVVTASNLISCSKSSPDPAPTPPDVCASKNIVVTLTAQPAAGCNNDGSIAASATGGTGFSFKLNTSGSYQASGAFANLAAGSYTVFGKDADGCEKTASVTVGASAAGPLFIQVKSLVTARCQSCHNNSILNGGMNWTVDCNIVANKTRIKVRAVDEGTMPATGPLSQAEKNVITNWINAGGRYTD